MSGNGLQAAIAGLRAAYAELAACDLSLLNRQELVAALDEWETLSCQLPTVGHHLLARLRCEATPQQLGAHTWKEVLRVRWRLSTSEANRRLTEAELLAPRGSVTGPSLPPVLPATAAAQARGLINAGHVDVIRRSVHKLPSWVDAATREKFEVDLVRIAVKVGPKELTDSAELILFLLDQDGPEPNDTERARKRGVTVSKQDPDGMVGWRASLTPEAWAVGEAIYAKYAAPGMCNPADPEPCTSGTPTQEQIDNDHRTLAQRQHDALVAVGRIALMSGELGKLNGLPVSVIIRTTLQDLESRAGVGTTGGGTVVPIADVIRMASHANHYLAVFDKATGSALDLFRARRTASPAQRIMLIARDGGCTKPCCTVGAYGSQVHHVVADWSKGGNTNVDELGLACGVHNRSVEDDGWTTRMNDRCEVEWTPPPGLDNGQDRVNYYHRPERLLQPDDEPSSAEDRPGEPPEAGAGSYAEARDPLTVDDAAVRGAGSPDPPTETEPSEEDRIDESESGAAVPPPGAGEHGGPGPPDDRAA